MKANVEIVSSLKRTIVEVDDSYFIYIPMLETEKQVLNITSNTFPCWRINIKKEK